MRVLHLNTYDYGGAAKAAYRLHQSLTDLGMESAFLVLDQTTSLPGIVAVRKRSRLTEAKSRIKRKLGSLLKSRNPDFHFYDQTESAVSDVEALLKKLPFRPDVIIAHWISEFLSPGDLRRLSQLSGAPVLWYLMDMAPLTGGCHYAWGCLRYTSQCGVCPALYSNNEQDLSHVNWKLKSEAVRNTPLVVVGGSAWNYEQAKRASVFTGKKVEKVIVSVDADVFSPGSKDTARRALGLPTDKKIVFFGAPSLGEKRKGIPYLVEALKILARSHDFDRSQVLAVSAGHAHGWASELAECLDYCGVGFLGSDEQLRNAYRAADVFVCPSVEDSGPMMINESMMCGTPVVSFDMGAAPDFVHTDRTGYRAVLQNSEDLAIGIQMVLNLSAADARRMSAQCRELALGLCHPRVQAEAFKRIIESALSETAHA